MGERKTLCEGKWRTKQDKKKNKTKINIINVLDLQVFKIWVQPIYFPFARHVTVHFTSLNFRIPIYEKRISILDVFTLWNCIAYGIKDVK